MDYNEMKEKLRREGMAEQKSKFMSTAGTPAQTSMRYGSMTDAEEKASAAKPAPMFESAPPSEAKAPTATVRGAPEEMTAEYYAPVAKQPAAPPPAAAPSLAAQLAERIKKADAELERLRDVYAFTTGAGVGIGGALGAGLGGAVLGPPGAAVGGTSGVYLGGLGGNKLADWELGEKWDAAEAARYAVGREVEKALRSGKITEEEWKAALSQQK